MTATPLETLLTTEQVAELLGLRPNLLREWKSLDDKDAGHRGPKATKLGRLVRYKPSDINAWIEQQNPAERIAS